MNNVQTISLPEAMKAVNPSTVAAMVRRINKALDERTRFEKAKAPNSAHIELRRASSFLRDNKSLARLFSVCSVDPNQVLNRTRKDGYRSNLKGMQKLKALLRYITGETLAFDRVSLALFASSIVAAKRGIKWISNNEQELILSSLPVGSLPKEVQEAIEYYKHKFMRVEGDSRNQACQFRTTFDNLGCYDFAREDVDDSNRLGIMVNLESPIIQHLNERWGLDSVE